MPTPQTVKLLQRSSEMWLYVLACLIILIAYYSLRRDPEPFLGVYSQPGKWFWLKYSLFYTFVFLRRLGLAWNAGYGRKARDTLDELDDVQKLSDHPLAIDAAYFNGYSKDGFYFGAGVQRRPKGRVESLLFIRVPDVGILEWPFSPSTATVEAEPDTYSAQGGLRFIRRIAMKSWRVTFDGELQKRETKEVLKVKFDFIWTAKTDWFDFDTDMHAHPVCEAIARESWDRAFFDRLHDAHQTHHEQFGVLKGPLAIEGLGEQQVELKSMRDHSYGLYRDWSDFHRYILQYFAFDDGSHLAVHLVSLKPTMTHLVTGFVTEKNGTKTPIYACNRPLYTIGENGQPPEKYDFTLTAGTKRLHVQCEKVQAPVYYCGWNQEAKLHVYMCKATMNGIEGRGMCEFEYNNVGKGIY